MAVPYTKGLHEVAAGIWAWLAPDGSWGWSNAGLVTGQDASLLVDTLFDLELTREMLTAMAPITARRPISDLVNTHGNGDHCFGNVLVPEHTRIHAAPGVSRHLVEDESPQFLAQVVSVDLGPVLTPFITRAFGPFRFDDISLRTPDQEITGPGTLTVGDREVHVLPLGPAHTDSDVVVHIPAAATVFAGDLLFIGSTPIMWAGPISSWIAALDTIIALDPDVIVPGHGPVTDLDGVNEVRAYLHHVDTQARTAFAAGIDWKHAALGMDLDRFASLRDAERITVTTYNIYRGLDPDLPQAAMVDLFTGMAEWDATRGTGSPQAGGVVNSGWSISRSQEPSG
ncbi:MBL fold metallo-hydrolase [Frankia tisae]|uniref:MBL fold metallo-hydrolase n=1 Tax=Frankia tisae TaxID=2950104 RepID=UPI0021BEB0E1|nr:MBL fold metallo-hydrolase [Frankia tisae]